MKKKIVLISGSPRKGNTDYILSNLYNLISCDKEIIYIRKKNIKHCKGCLNCYKNLPCSIKDDMAEVAEIISKGDILVIGSPNYFDNVPGILKDFIDRTAICLAGNVLKNKKIFFVIVGGGRIKNSKLVATQALRNFSEKHELKEEKIFCFKFTNNFEASDDGNCISKIKKIAKAIEKI